MRVTHFQITDDVNESEENLQCAASVQQLSSIERAVETTWLWMPENRPVKLRGVTMWEDNVKLGDREGDGGRKFNGAGMG
jgi:hypothetical protein